MRSVPPRPLLWAASLTCALAVLPPASRADDPPPQVDAVSGAGQVAPSSSGGDSGAAASQPQQLSAQQRQAIRDAADSSVGQIMTQTGSTIYKAFSGLFGGDKGQPALGSGPAPAAKPPSSADVSPADRTLQDANAAAAASGRRFATQQDKVNYYLCSQGQSVACGHIHYTDSPAASATGAKSGGVPAVGGSPTGVVPGNGGSGAAVGAGDGAGGGSGDGGSGGQAGSGPSEVTRSVTQHSAEALARAGALGEAMKRLSSQAQSMPDGLGAGAAGLDFGGQHRAGSAGAGTSMSLAAAAASGFGASFQAVGLKMGTGARAGQVVRADGTPATPEDLTRLRAQIAADPQALMTRPDFFQVVDRATFGRLKTEFNGQPAGGVPQFRHVGLTEADRDFVHTATCDKNLETGCNPLAAKPYKKGEFVAPEDLKKIDESLKGKDEDSLDGGRDEPEERAADESPGPERRALDKRSVRSIAARLNDLIGGALGALHGGLAHAGVRARRKAGAGPGYAETAGDQADGGGAGGSGAAAASGGAAGRLPPEAPAPPEPPAEKSASRRAAAAGAAALGLLGAGALWAARRLGRTI